MNTTQPQSTASTFSFHIPSERIGEMEARIAALNKKAAKCGIPPIECKKDFEIVKKFFLQPEHPGYYTDQNQEVEVLYTPCTITFYPIKVVGNFKFVASIEHEMIDGKNHNIVSGYNITEVEEKKYRHCSSACQHCNVNRFRNKTFVVKSESGELKQVGSSCLKDFFNCDVQSAITSLDIATELSSFDEEDSFGGFGRTSRLAKIRDMVVFSVCHIREFGFVSATKAKEDENIGLMSTPSYVLILNQLFPPLNMKKEDKIIPTDDDYVVADKIIADWNEKLVPQLNDDILDTFQYKIAFTVALGYVKPKLNSVIVGAVGHCMKKIQEEKSPKKISLNEFVPNVSVGEKVQLELVLSRINKFDSAYGTTSILGFSDADGRKVVWFASGSVDEVNDWIVGNSYKVKGTVKDLKDDPKYGKQTILTRVKKIT